jgi:glycosyltransferase involved in cell wall biosynthesis
VATRMGGAAEIITDSGLLVAPGDPQSLAESLRLLVSSPEKRLCLGRRGPDRARSLCDPAAQMNEMHRALSGLARGAFSASEA